MFLFLLSGIPDVFALCTFGKYRHIYCFCNICRLQRRKFFQLMTCFLCFVFSLRPILQTAFYFSRLSGFGFYAVKRKNALFVCRNEKYDYFCTRISPARPAPCNPPGLDRSKGTMCSGAMQVAYPFVCLFSSVGQST